MMPTLTDLFDRFTSINGGVPNTPPIFRIFQKYPILRPTGRKAFEYAWGLVVTAFNFKIHGEVMRHPWSDATSFESREFWDCLNDGWMRDYIYPYDNIYSRQPSPERLLRLGPTSFRGWIDLPSTAEIEANDYNLMTIQMHTDTGLSFDLEFNPIMPYENVFDDDKDDILDLDDNSVDDDYDEVLI